jgi:MFS family permease
VGPVIAGAILQFASWRWLFLINLPVGVLALALAAAFLPNDREETRPRGLDLLGLVLLSPGLVLFLYSSDHLGERIGIVALAVSIIMFALFYRTARAKGDAALIDLRLLKGKVFSASTVAMFMVNGITFAGQMLIPIYLVRACGLSPSRTGWLLAPLGLGMMCTYPFMGLLTKRFGIRKLAACGALLALAGTLPLVFLAQHGLVVTVLAASLHSRRWRQCHRHSVDHLGLCISGASGFADGDDRHEHYSTPRRPDVDDTLRDLPWMAPVGDARYRDDIRRLHCGVQSALRPARAAVPRHPPAALGGSLRRTCAPISRDRPAACLKNTISIGIQRKSVRCRQRNCQQKLGPGRVPADLQVGVHLRG